MTLTVDISAFFRVGAFIAIALVAIAIVYVLVKNIRHFFATRRYDGMDRDMMKRRWKEVESLLAQPGEVTTKLAIIEADKLLDHALKSMAMPGNTLGERLKFASYKYPKIRNVWWAHKVRNMLVHETSYHLDRGTAKKAITAFERALKLLGAL